MGCGAISANAIAVAHRGWNATWLLAKPDDMDMKEGGYRSLDSLLAGAPSDVSRHCSSSAERLGATGRPSTRFWGRHAPDRQPRAGAAPFELDEFDAAVAEAPLGARFTSDFESDLSRPLRLNLDEWPRRSPLERAREKFWSMLSMNHDSSILAEE